MTADDGDRFSAIERKLDHTCFVVESLSEQMQKHTELEMAWNDRLTRTIYGYNGTPGLLLKLDRLEQAQERQKWLVRAVVGAMLGLLAALLSARVL